MITKTIQRRILERFNLALLTVLFGIPGMTGALFAQDEENVMEEVVVTSQRREQTILEVPMAVTAFTQEALAELQADNLDSIQGAVPNLNLVQGRGSSSSVNIFIRGVGQPDALQTFDPAVGLYVDDVYMSRIQGGMFKLYDIERIEVLRGPQGTLYGKNTPGGAIRLITRTPGQEVVAQAGVLGGNYGRFQADAYLSGPLSDDFALGFSVLYDTRNGFVTDPSDGRKYNDADTLVTRLKGNWDVSDDVNIVFSADYTKEDTRLTLGRMEADLISVDLLTGPFVREPAPVGEWNFETQTSLPYQDGQKLDNYGGNITLNWDINDAVSLKSITAYRKLKYDTYIDIDATQWEFGDVFVGIDQSQFSQEFQLLGDNGGNLNWVAGLYFLHEKVPSNQAAYADDWLTFGGIPITLTRTIADDLDTKSYAAFGQIDYQIAPDWTLGAGIRYTYEKKDYFRTTSTFSNLLGNADPAFAFDDADNWSDWTPTFTVDYSATDDVHVYGRLAKGFKSGGFNGRANNADDKSSFDPETVWTAELGAKTLVADGRFQANYAIFKSNYKDFQARVSLGDDPLDFSFPVLNAAKLHIWGAEFEGIWVPVDPLQLSAQIGYLDSKYAGDGFTGADLVPDEPAFSPEWTVRLAGMYTFDLSGGSTLSFNAAGTFIDSMWLSVDNLDTLYQTGFWTLDGFIAWHSASEHWTVTAGIKNAADKVYKVEGQEFRSVGNIQTAYYGDPRTYTLSVDYVF